MAQLSYHEKTANEAWRANHSFVTIRHKESKKYALAVKDYTDDSYIVFFEDGGHELYREGEFKEQFELIRTYWNCLTA